MNILVKKDNKTFGPYTRDEILEFIQVDELSQDDLGTWEGEESWLPLVSLLASPQNYSWRDQPLAPGTVRTSLEFRAAIGTAAKIATAVKYFFSII